MSLVPRITLGALDLTDHPYALEFGADLGNPQNVNEILSSLIADGEIISPDRASNREMSLTILVEGSDMLALAEAEAALIRECGKASNTLTFDPGDGFGPATVFDTFRADVVAERSDEAEMAGIRRFVLTIPAMPYGRSVDKVTDDAEAVDIASGTVYDDGTSATNWAGWLLYRTPAVVVDSGAVKIEWGALTTQRAVADGESYNEWQNKDTRSGLSVATGTGGYLSQVVRLERMMSEDIALSGGGVARSRVAAITMTTSTGSIIEAQFAAVEQLSNGRVRYAWPVAAGLTIASVTFHSYQYALTFQGPTEAHVWYDDLIFSDATTTSNQYAKVVDIAGSARAPGAIHVAASVALDNVLVLSMPEDKIAPGFTADGRKWVTSVGGTTPDETAMHGSYFQSGLTHTFEVPVTMLTEGAYSIVLLTQNASPTSATVTARLVIGGTVVGSAQTITNSEPTDGTTGYRFFTVGELYLPPRPMQAPDSTCKVRFTITGASFAEFYMCPTWGDLTLAKLGTGTVSPSGASSHLWIDSPSPERPMGAWWRGASPERALATSAVASLVQPGRHLLYPDRTRIFVASSSASGPTVTVDYFPRWHGLAAS